MRSFRPGSLHGCVFIFICSVMVNSCAESGPVEVAEINHPRIKINYAATPDLVIKWYPDTISLYLDGDSLITTDSNEASGFIEQRISKIDKQKVLFIGETDTSYQQFKDITAILRKHDILKFRILASNEVY